MKQPSESEKGRFAANLQIAAGRHRRTADLAAIGAAFDAGAITEKYGFELAANLDRRPLPQAVADFRPKASAATTKPHKPSPKSEDTVVSEASHPHLFAAFPALHQTLDKSGRTLMNSATLQAYERGAATQGVGDFRQPGIVADTRRPHVVGDGGRSPAAGKREQDGMAALECEQVNGEVMKSWSPCVRDRMRSGSSTTEMSEQDLDDWFAARRAARASAAAHRRR